MGSSDKPIAGYDKKTMAQNICELLRHLSVAKAALLGHDIGGMVATSFGLITRRRFRPICLTIPYERAWMRAAP